MIILSISRGLGAGVASRSHLIPATSSGLGVGDFFSGVNSTTPVGLGTGPGRSLVSRSPPWSGGKSGHPRGPEGLWCPLGGKSGHSRGYGDKSGYSRYPLSGLSLTTPAVLGDVLLEVCPATPGYLGINPATPWTWGRWCFLRCNLATSGGLGIVSREYIRLPPGVRGKNLESPVWVAGVASQE